MLWTLAVQFYMQNTEQKKSQVKFYKQELSKPVFTTAHLLQNLLLSLLHKISLLLETTQFLALLNWEILLSSPI